VAEAESKGGAIGPAGLLLAGLGSLIGSGWLFGPWRTAQLAGPGALAAWAIAGVLIAIVAATFAELGAMFPETGGAVRYGFYSHGSVVGLLAAWANWVALVTVMPVEAEATVQYMATWGFRWSQGLASGSTLSWPGIALAAVLMGAYYGLNAFGVRVFVRFNGVITAFKLIVPLVTAGALLTIGFHAANFTTGLHPGSAPIQLASVLGAAATSGIVFSLNGFQTPINLSGEARDPGRTLPVGMFGSLAIAIVVYLLLQLAFLGAVPPEKAQRGWAAVSFSSPFAELAGTLGLGWLAGLLYVDAVASPTGTGTTYTATTARIVQAVQRSGGLPALLNRTVGRNDVPLPAMTVNLAVGIAFLVLFPGWSALAAVISVACIISYLPGPVGVATLRRTAPDADRPFRLPGLRWAAGLAFVGASLLLYWARWPNTGEVLLLMLGAVPFFVVAARRQGWRGARDDLRAGVWLVTFLLAMALISFVGAREFGGRGLLPFGPDLAVVAIVGALFYWWGVRSGWRTPAMAARLDGDET
jgi:amino acid transporter